MAGIELLLNHRSCRTVVTLIVKTETLRVLEYGYAYTTNGYGLWLTHQGAVPQSRSPMIRILIILHPRQRNISFLSVDSGRQVLSAMCIWIRSTLPSDQRYRDVDLYRAKVGFLIPVSSFDRKLNNI